jgi:hypothetical protein
MSNKKAKSNFNNVQSRYSNLSKDLKLVISGFLVDDRPGNINPRYKLADNELKFIKYPPKTILMSLVTLTKLFAEYRHYYIEILRGLKLYYYLDKFANVYFDVKLLAATYGLVIRLESPITDFNFAYVRHQCIGRLKYDGGGEITDEEEETTAILFTKLESVPKEYLYIYDPVIEPYWGSYPIPEIYKLPIKNTKTARKIEIETRIPYVPNIKICTNDFMHYMDYHMSIVLDSDKFPVLKKDIRMIKKDHESVRMYFTLTLAEFKKMIGI